MHNLTPAHLGQQPAAELVLTTLGAAGGSQRGTTDTDILRFLNETLSVGSAISWADNAANATRVTLGSRGLYAVSCTGYVAGSGENTGALAISRDTTTYLSTAIDGNASAPDFLDVCVYDTTAAFNCAVSMFALVKVTAAEGSAVIRVHGDSQGVIGDPPDLSVDMRLRVVRIGDVVE